MVGLVTCGVHCGPCWAILWGHTCTYIFSCGIISFSEEESSNLLLGRERQTASVLGDEWESVVGSYIQYIIPSSNCSWDPLVCRTSFLKEKLLILGWGGTVTCYAELGRDLGVSLLLKLWGNCLGLCSCGIPKYQYLLVFLNDLSLPNPLPTPRTDLLLWGINFSGS